MLLCEENILFEQRSHPAHTRVLKSSNSVLVRYVFTDSSELALQGPPCTRQLPQLPSQRAESLHCRNAQCQTRVLLKEVTEQFGSKQHFCLFVCNAGIVSTEYMETFCSVPFIHTIKKKQFWTDNGFQITYWIGLYWIIILKGAIKAQYLPLDDYRKVIISVVNWPPEREGSNRE